ncbi:2-oxoglutarate dehydrogenase E1 subunit family protein, partial [Nocardioides sp.]
MTQSSDQSTGSPVPADFGANEWLVEEMKERFESDPSSVDPAWVAYFKGEGGSGGNGMATAAPKAPAAPATAAPPKP